MKNLIYILPILFLSACSSVPEEVREVIADGVSEAIRNPPTPTPTPEAVSTPVPAPVPVEPKEPEYSRRIQIHKDGFLWKPISERKTLVVLTPTQTRGQFVRGEIRRILGDVLVEVGRFDGDVHNGRRPHYRFSKTGADYGDGLVFRGVRADGSFMQWTVPEGAARVE